MHYIPKYIGHSESSGKRKTQSSMYLQKETGKSIHYDLGCTPENSKTKKSKYTQKQQMKANNQTKSRTQPSRSKKKYSKNKKQTNKQIKTKKSQMLVL